MHGMTHSIVCVLPKEGIYILDELMNFGLIMVEIGVEYFQFYMKTMVYVAYGGFCDVCMVVWEMHVFWLTSLGALTTLLIKYAFY